MPQLGARSAAPSTLLEPDDLTTLQRTAGNQAVSAMIDEGSLPVQRAVLTSTHWKKKSSRVGRRRGEDLVKIDMALAAYHRDVDADPQEQLKRLDALYYAINVWEAGKTLSKGSARDATRYAAVAALKASVQGERQALQKDVAALKNPTDASSVRASALNLAQLAQAKAKSVLATPPPKRSFASTQSAASDGSARGRDALAKVSAGVVKSKIDETRGVRNDALHLRNKAKSALDDSDAGQKSALALARATFHLANATRAMAYVHLLRFDASRPLDKHRGRFHRAKSRLPVHLTTAKAAGLAPDVEPIESMIRNINIYEAFLPSGKEDGGNTDVIEGSADVLDLVTGMTGYQGTGGKGNEGMAEFHKDSHPGVKEAFSKWDPGSKSQDDFAADLREKAKQAQADGDPEAAKQYAAHSDAVASLSNAPRDVMSGISDMIGSGAASVQDVIGFAKAFKTLNDDDADASDKRDAIFDITAGVFGSVATVMKFTGGLMTALRGAGVDLGSSNFGFASTSDDGGVTFSSGVDTSTDVKLAGDFAGLFSGMINTVKEVVNLVKYIKDGGEGSAKAQKRTTRKDLEAVGGLVHRYTGAVNSLAGNTKALTKLAFQIKDGGQIADTGAGQIANLGGVVPALGLIKLSLDVLRHSYKLWRIGMRRTDLTKRLRAMRDTERDGRKLEAVEVVRATLVKRSARVGIELGHSLAGIIASGLNTSGIGMAPGMVINLSSTALKLGQVGLREGKQILRDRKAKDRAKKDLVRLEGDQQILPGDEEKDRVRKQIRAEAGTLGAPESMADWRNRKRLEAARKGRKAQLLTAMDIAITRDWDRAKQPKEKVYRLAAIELLEMNDKGILKDLGCWDALEAIDADPKKGMKHKIAAIIGALKKRD